MKNPKAVEKLQLLASQILGVRTDEASSGSGSYNNSSSSDVGEKSSNSDTSHANNENNDPSAEIPGITKEDKKNAKKGFKIEFTAGFSALTEIEVKVKKTTIDGDYFGYATEKIPDDLLHIFHDYFDLWVCSGAAVDSAGYAKWLEVAFRQENMTKAEVGNRALSFFSRVLDTFEFPDFADTGPFYNVWEPRRVYIGAQLAHPRGYMVANVMQRRDAALGLYVSFFGVGNPRMCTCCHRKQKINRSISGEPILAPFPECISLRRVRAGTCSNCVWDGRNDCSWKSLGGYLTRLQHPYVIGSLPPGLAVKEVAVLNRWIDDVNLIFAPGGLNDRSCPRITCKLTNLETDRKKRQKDLEEAKKKILEIELESELRPE
ncbi:hypothetical protein EDB81DRAFT_889038 [Dactylonectria macrodidyma]|uniref:Uncharacterized protein n=1 Tax=Dactylonectria macrodidyma TaxID=307937 RepID=A0A9P9IS81_9HYPO|nr:hypothetical protein EDB81DRAFT_889038 [Dactylonectria macrodidyma]